MRISQNLLKLLSFPFLSFLFLSLFSAAPLWSWSQNGHRIVGQIAESLLSKEAKAELKKILGKKTLAQISNWPDKVRSDKSYKCAAPLHYVSIEDNQTYESSSKAKDGDILSALVYFENVLRGSKAKISKVDALSFYVHLLGDLHQPLHVGRACDRGGNSVAVNWFDQKTNLHHVWDYELVESEKLSYKDYAEFLLNTNIQAKDLEKMRSGGYLDWAADSMRLRSKVYQCYKDDKCQCDEANSCQNGAAEFGQCLTEVKKNDSENKNLKDTKIEETKKIEIPLPQLKYQYVFQNIDNVENQLLKGGVRLAAALETILRPNAQNKAAAAKQQKQFSAEIEMIDRCFSR